MKAETHLRDQTPGTPFYPAPSEPPCPVELVADEQIGSVELRVGGVPILYIEPGHRCIRLIPNDHHLPTCLDFDGRDGENCVRVERDRSSEGESWWPPGRDEGLEDPPSTPPSSPESTPEETLAILEMFADGPMRAKALLGWRVASSYHGVDAANRAMLDWADLHIRGVVPEEIPTVEVDPHPLMAPRLLVEMGWKPSTTQARADIQGGALSIDGRRVQRQDETIQPTDGMVVRLGKKRIARLKVRLAPTRGGDNPRETDE